MKRLQLSLAFLLVSLAGFSQQEEGFNEPEYHSKQVINIKLSDLPKEELHGLAYEIQDYDPVVQDVQFLKDIAIENYLHLREHRTDKIVFISENNVSVIIYSEEKFLSNYKALHGKLPNNSQL